MMNQGEIARLREWGWNMSREEAARPDAVHHSALVPIEFACNALVSAEACR